MMLGDVFQRFVPRIGAWHGLVGTDAAQDGLAAARHALPRELARTRCPTESYADVTLGLAEPGGGTGDVLRS